MAVKQKTLVKKAMRLLGERGKPLSQSELGRRIHDLGICPLVTSQSTVNKWLADDTKHLKVALDHAVCLDVLTKGAVALSDFYPQVIHATHYKKPKRKSEAAN